MVDIPEAEALEGYKMVGAGGGKSLFIDYFICVIIQAKCSVFIIPK